MWNLAVRVDTGGAVSARASMRAETHDWPFAINQGHTCVSKRGLFTLMTCSGVRA
jgi:hypothetical protein